MSESQRLAERIKLGRQLHCPVEQITFVDKLDAETMRLLRADITAAMEDDNRGMFGRAAKACALVPNSMLADISENIAGPMLSARIVGMLSPDTAANIALRCSDTFLAAATAYVDPNQAAPLIRQIPPTRVSRIAKLLVAQEEFVTLGRFVNYVDHELIEHVIADIDSDEALLKAAFYIESGEIINELIHLLPDDRLERLALSASHSKTNLWAEALALTEHMSDEWKGRLGDIVASEGEDLLTAMLYSARDMNLWDGVLPVVACMNDKSRAKLVKLPALADPALLRTVIEAADKNDLWPMFLPLISGMPSDTRQTAVHLVEELPDDLIIRMLESALKHHLWPHMLALVAEMDEAQTQRVATLLAKQSDAFIIGFVKDMQNELPKVVDLFDRLTEGQREKILTLIAQQPSDLLDKAATAVKAGQGLLNLIKPTLKGLDATIQGRFERLLGNNKGNIQGKNKDKEA